MADAITIGRDDAERIHAMLRQLKQDVHQLESIVTTLQTVQKTPDNDDIFAEMAGLAANAPNADDSRAAIYTRMPGE